jgi:hypothetical protein
MRRRFFAVLIISHVKIIAFQLSLFCKNYRFSKTALYIISRKIHGCLEIPDLFLVLNIQLLYGFRVWIWPDPNTGFDQSEHALYTCYFIT